MKKQLEQVKQFMLTSGQEVLEVPTIPDLATCNLRFELIREENRELQDAFDKKNIVEVGDALTDLLYVVFGAIIAFGLEDKAVDLFEEVQSSNMSKFCLTEQEAKDTVAHYHSKSKIGDYTYKLHQGKYIILRTIDNKVMKSINYSPANLTKIINN